MIRLIRVLLICLLLQIFMISWSSGQEWDWDDCLGPSETEPNDTIDQANVLRVPGRFNHRISGEEFLGWIIDGRCCDDGDSDWYALSGEEGTEPILRFEHGMRVYPVVDVYSGAELVASSESDDYGFASSTPIQVPGKCYVHVHGAGYYYLEIEVGGEPKSLSQSWDSIIIHYRYYDCYPDFPAVLLGGTTNGDWVNSMDIMPQDGQEYRMYSSAGYIGDCSGSELVSPDYEVGMTGSRINLDCEIDFSESEGFYGISCSWDPQPRTPVLDFDHSKYFDIAESLFEDDNVQFSDLAVNRVTSVDLEGDGHQETIVETSLISDDSDCAEFGETTLFFAFLIHHTGENDDCVALTGLSNECSVAPLDVDGDGIMEIVVSELCFEVTVHSLFYPSDKGWERATLESYGV